MFVVNKLLLIFLSIGELQPLSDILRYASHGDPQLKGNTAVLVGNLMWAILRVSHGNMNKWLKQHEHTGEY